MAQNLWKKHSVNYTRIFRIVWSGKYTGRQDPNLCKQLLVFSPKIFVGCIRKTQVGEWTRFQWFGDHVWIIYGIPSVWQKTDEKGTIDVPYVVLNCCSNYGPVCHQKHVLAALQPTFHSLFQNNDWHGVHLFRSFACSINNHSLLM